MTTPLGDRRRRAIARTARVTVARTTRETQVTVELDLDGSGVADIATGVGFYDHLLGSLAHHGLFDLDDRGDRRPPRRRAPHRRGRRAGARLRRSPRRSATGPGSTGSATRPCRWTRPWPRRSSTSAGGLRGRRPAVPRRAGRRAAAPARRARARGVRPDVRRRRSTCGAPAGTTTTWPRPRSRRSAGRSAPPCALDPRRTASPRRRARSDERRDRSRRPRVAVVDYGAGNLVSIGQALAAVGADVVASPATRRRSDGADLLVVPGVGAAAPAMVRLARATASSSRSAPGSRAGPAVPRHLPRAPAPVRGQRRGRRARRSASSRAARSRLDGAPTLPHIGWNQVDRRRDHPVFDGIADGRRLLLRPLLRRRAGGPDAADVILADDRATDGRFVSAVARGPHRSASSSIPSGAARTACGCSPMSSSCCAGRVARRGSPPVAAGPADAPPPGHPLPRRRRRPRRQGHPLRRPRRRGRPARARRALRRARAPTSSSSSTSRRRRRAAARSSTSSSGPRAGCSSRSRSAAACGASTRCATCSAPAPTRSRSTRPRSPTRTLVAALRRALRPPGRRRRDRRPPDPTRPGGPAGRSWSRAAASRRGSTPWRGPSAPSTLGAGELLVTSIDRDGTRSGFDTALLRSIAIACRVPVIASGGAAGPEDFVAAVRDGGADAVLAASIFHRRLHSIARGQAGDGRRRAAGPARRGGRGMTSGCPTTQRSARERSRSGARRARPRDRAGRGRWPGPDAGLDGRGGAGGTLDTGVVHFHSRTRDRLWRKGESSGHELRVRASPSTATPTRSSSSGSGRARPATGTPAAASTRRRRRGRPRPEPDRRRGTRQQGSRGSRRSGRRSLDAPPSGPTAPTPTRLLDGGVDAVGRKVTEEATEVLHRGQGRRGRRSRLARIATQPRTPSPARPPTSLYHALVLLAERDVRPADVIEVLRARHAG